MPYPYIMGFKEEASADTTIQAIVKKPVGAKVYIKRINVVSDKNFDFGRWLGYIYPTGFADYPREILFRKIVPQTGTYGAVLFEGRQEWLHGWEIYLRGKTQTTLNKVWWSITYEIEPPEKKGWGQ